MLNFIADNIVTIFFGIITAIVSVIALRYKILEHKRSVENIVGEGRNAVTFLSREATLSALFRMYDKAGSGDVIWVQCVGCANYTEKVRGKVLEAAGKGVAFNLILNKYSPSVKELKSLYAPLSKAEFVEGSDNALRIQGLSDREVILALPEVNAYTGILIKDPYTVKIFKVWFENRFLEIKEGLSQHQ